MPSRLPRRGGTTWESSMGGTARCFFLLFRMLFGNLPPALGDTSEQCIPLARPRRLPRSQELSRPRGRRGRRRPRHGMARWPATGPPGPGPAGPGPSGLYLRHAEPCLRLAAAALNHLDDKSHVQGAASGASAASATTATLGRDGPRKRRDVQTCDECGIEPNRATSGQGQGMDDLATNHAPDDSSSRGQQQHPPVRRPTSGGHAS